jgi:hypothetical protein
MISRLNYAPILFLFINFGTMVSCLICIAFIKHPEAYGISALIYTGVILFEGSCRILSPVSLCMMVSFFVFYLFSSKMNALVGYEGVCIFSCLVFLNAFLVLLKKPLSMFYSRGRGNIKLHYVNSYLWIFGYLMSLISIFYFIPSILFLIVPWCVCILTGLATIVTSLIWCGNSHCRSKIFTDAGFTFKQISLQSQEFMEYCVHYVDATIQDSENSMIVDRQTLIDNLIDENTKLAGSARHFIAIDKKFENIIGTFRCIVDRSGRNFPIEQLLETSYDPLRSFGRLMDVGCFSIHPNYRSMPILTVGLFRCMMDLALERDVRFLVADAPYHRVSLYQQIGFRFLFPPSHMKARLVRSDGMVCYPLVLNLTEAFFGGSSGGNPGWKLGSSVKTNWYLFERWNRRLMLSSWFRRKTKWPWTIMTDDIYQLIAR